MESDEIIWINSVIMLIKDQLWQLQNSERNRKKVEWIKSRLKCIICWYEKEHTPLGRHRQDVDCTHTDHWAIDENMCCSVFGFGVTVIFFFASFIIITFVIEIHAWTHTYNSWRTHRLVSASRFILYFASKYTLNIVHTHSTNFTFSGVFFSLLSQRFKIQSFFFLRWFVCLFCVSVVRNEETE